MNNCLVKTRGRLVIGLVLIALAFSAHAQNPKPRVLILMQEKVMGLFDQTGWEVPTQAELTIASVLQQNGFTVIDADTLRRNTKRDKWIRMLNGDNKGASTTGLTVGAEYSIIGTAISKPAGAKLLGTQMKSIHATLNARVVRSDTASVIRTASSNATKVHIDALQGGVQAIEEAATILANQLVAGLSATSSSGLTDSSVGAGQLTMTLSGLVSFRHLDYLVKWLEDEVAEVSAVEVQSFQGNAAELSLTTNSSSSNLASLVVRKRFKGFHLNPSSVTPHRLDLQVVRNKKN